MNYFSILNNNTFDNKKYWVLFYRILVLLLLSVTILFLIPSVGLITKNFKINNFRKDNGFCYILEIPQTILWWTKILPNNSIPRFKAYENDIPMSPSSSIDNIRNKGMGGYQQYGNLVYLSATDNSNPNLNKKEYKMSCAIAPPSILSRVILISILLVTLFPGRIFTILNYASLKIKTPLIVQELFIPLAFIPAVILVIYIISGAISILYIITFCIYYPLTLLLLKIFREKTTITILFFFVSIIFLARLFHASNIPSTKDMTGLSVFDIKKGECIEQDFYLPKHDWKLNRLLNDNSIYTVLRIVGDIDTENTTLYINAVCAGKMSSLIISQAQKLFGFPVNNYVLRIPKHLLENTEIVTLRIESAKAFTLAYSSGLAPLPAAPHDRLIKNDGSVEDIANSYYHRRFRFQIAIYLISDKYFTKERYALMMGSIL